MKKNQRAAIASRLRQFSELRQAAVSTETALAAATADNPVAGEVLAGRVTPESPADFLPPSMPHTRALLTASEDRVSNALVGVVADVLDEPGSRGAGSLMYVSLVGTGLVVFLFSIFVAPTFQNMFESFGAQLPAPTVLALFLAQWVIGPMAALLVFLVLVRAIWTFRPELLGTLTQLIDSMLMNTPLLGQANRIIQTKRLAEWLAATGTRDDLKQRLECLIELAGPGQFGRQVSRLAKAVHGGQTLHEALAAPGWLPGLAMVLQDAESVDADTVDPPGKKLCAYAIALDARSDPVTAPLTLIAQLIVGLVVAFFVVAMYLPIFKLGSVI